jgi:hypothetical protein
MTTPTRLTALSLRALAEDVAAWRACSSSLLEAYMERTGEAGPKLFAAYGKLRTDACCREAPGDTPFSHR